MPGARKALVPLAVVTGAHGVRGELRVKPYNPSSELLASLARATLRAAGGGAEREVTLHDARRHGQTWLVVLEGCSDRDAAQALRGSELCVPREQLPAPDEGEHYLVDLIGLQARLPDGRPFGDVQEALQYPASHALRVAVPGGSVEVPLAPPYVVEIRLDEGVVIVDHVEDLDLEPARKPRR